LPEVEVVASAGVVEGRRMEARALAGSRLAALGARTVLKSKSYCTTQRKLLLKLRWFSLLHRDVPISTFGSAGRQKSKRINCVTRHHIVGNLIRGNLFFSHCAAANSTTQIAFILPTERSCVVVFIARKCKQHKLPRTRSGDPSRSGVQRSRSLFIS